MTSRIVGTRGAKNRTVRAVHSARLLPIIVTCAAVLAAACGPADRGDPGTQPYGFLSARLEEAFRKIEEARRDPGAVDPDLAQRLQDASRSVRRVLEYYLPVLDARLQTDRARYLAVTDAAAARNAIDSARTILLVVAETHGRHLQEEMREPLERLESARTMLGSGETDDARELLGELSHRLELLFFRGEIVLSGSVLDPDAPDDR